VGDSYVCHVSHSQALAKQKWLRAVHGCCRTPRAHIFQDIAGMQECAMHCAQHGKLCRIPSGDSGPHLVHIGFSCKDLSKLKGLKPHALNNMLEKGEGSTGETAAGMLRLLRSKSPPMVILENVTELVTTDDGALWRWLRLEIEAAGYVSDYRIFQSHDYGVPQQRKRFFSVCLNLKFLNLKPPAALALVSEAA
jgi:site-specific DNA-cytosine methylase